MTRRLANACAALTLTAASLLGSIPGASGGQASAAPAATAGYVALQPCRLADTRQAGGFSVIDPLTIQISARSACGVPAAATSLALTLTVVGPASNGYLTAWPASQARPTVSSLNFRAGQVRANGSITRLDPNGAFRVYTSVDSDVVVDVVGAFVPATSVASGRFVARTPARLHDSRTGQKPSAGSRVTVAIPAGIPRDAVALALNITITESSGPGFVTAFPAGQAMPTTSILNLDAVNQTRAAAGVFPVSTDGIGLYVSGGGHVVVDLLGYFTGPSAARSSEGLFTAYDPTRLLDTRGASPLGNGVPVYPGGGLELATSQGGAMAYNITSVDGATGYITAYPAGTERPPTSTVNAPGGSDTVANFSITQVSNRGLGLLSQAQTHLLVDLQGWFSGPTASASQPPPTNTAPPVPKLTFSACTHDGLASVNQQRALVGARALVVNAGAEAFACTWALTLAQNNAGLSHSDGDVRSAVVGCPAGENIAVSSGTSWESLMSMWYGSAPHMTNVRNNSYNVIGIGYVIRTEASGATSIWGVMTLAIC